MACGQPQGVGGPVDSFNDQFGVKSLSDKLGNPLGQPFQDVVRDGGLGTDARGGGVR